MTELMKKAITQLRALHPEQQDYFAQLILDELEDERIWDELFAKSQGRWGKLMAKVIAEHRAGLTKELDPDNLTKNYTGGFHE